LIARLILTPFSWIFGLVTGIRNLLYDKSILKSYSPGIPVIVVGNLLAGGTGKSPTVVWLARELSSKYKVAILSRGYGRKTRGFQLLDSASTPETVGDEPMEMKLLLPDLTMAVDTNRKRGIQYLASDKYGKTDVILMDDGFQHRKVKPGFAIVLDNFNRPMRSEPLLPAGLRREPLSGLKRADLIVATKRKTTIESVQSGSRIFLITGIAHPLGLVSEISKTGQLIHHLRFADHHSYSHADGVEIRRLYQSFLANDQSGATLAPPIILTTGKDYVKLIRLPELSDLPLQWIPVGPPVDPEEKQNILNKIFNYVEKAHGKR